MGQREWCEKAYAKAIAFLPGIDRSLRVEIRHTKATETREREHSEHHSEFVLAFRHELDPVMEWTIEIVENDHYIANELEGVVRNEYRKHRGW